MNVSSFDQIFMLDIIEHLKDPERFMDELRFASGCKRPELVMTTANIGFSSRASCSSRAIQLRPEGYSGCTHTRLFTFRSLNALLEQSGYKVLEMRGIPAPFPKALGTISSRACCCAPIRC